MIELKEHNIEPYNRLCEALEKNNKVGYESATGTGKSYVGGKYVEEHGLEDKTLVLVPSNVIRDGWKKMIPGINTMTYQSMLNLKGGLQKYSLIICDEMHHLGAEQWGQKFREMTDGFNGKMLGMSATPIRFLDNRRNMIEEMFEGNRVLGLELPEAIKEGILPSFDYITVLYNLGSSKPKNTGRNSELTEKLYKQLDAMENEHSFQTIIRKHMKPGMHKVAVFVPEISQLKTYKSVVEAVYPDAIHIVAHSKMGKAEIKKRFSEFELSRRTSFIYTVDLLNEGAHIDGVDTVIMFRKTESPTIFLQQLGRALTTNKSGGRITIFDFVANHANVRAKEDGAGSIVDWIGDAVGAGKHQIIKHDYAKAEIEVLEQLRDLLSPKWTPREDDLIRQNYNEGKGLDELVCKMQGRTRAAISTRATVLGLTNKFPYDKKQLEADITSYYKEDGGLDFLIDKYPKLTKSYLQYAARKLGLIQKQKNAVWSEEEDSIIKNNPEMAVRELRELLPGKTSSQISSRRSVFGLTKPHDIWTDEDRKIIEDHPEMSWKELQREYFPHRSVMAVKNQGRFVSNRRGNRWPKEKKEKFIRLYSQGGSMAVMADDEFSDMKPQSIGPKAAELGVISGNKHQEPWSEKETDIIMNYLIDVGDGKPDYDHLASLLPNRTRGSIKCRFCKLRRTANA